MKCSVILSAALLSGSLLLSGCGQQGGKNGEQESQTAQTEATRPSAIIPLNQAQQSYRRYSARRVPIIRKYEDSVNLAMKAEKPFTAARYVAFDYKTLKDYITYIEQEAGKVNADITSLRVYFGNNAANPGPMHPRQNTVMLVPAVKADPQSNEQWGLYINNGQAGYLSMDLRPTNPKEQQTQQREEAGFLPAFNLLMQGDGSLILNEGSSAPPPYN